MRGSCQGICLVVAAAAGSAFLGCAATGPPPTPAEQISPDLIMKLPTAALDHSRLEWTPVAGRMNPATRHRHLPADVGGLTLWSDELDGGDTRLPVEWTMVGEPRINLFRVESLAGLEISAHGEGRNGCWLERRLDPAQLGGREVRLSIEIACPSPRRLERLKKVLVSVVSEGGPEGGSKVLLPLSVELSPGWETLEWWLRFEPQMGPSLLRVDFPDPDAGMVVRRIAMSAGRADIQAVASAPAPVESGAITNLIAGGDFETGRRMFFASGLRPWPNGNPTSTPLLFEYEGQAAVGERCLKLSIPTGMGRLGFGPLDLNRPAGEASTSAWYLKFHARTTRPATVSASIRGAHGVLDKATFTTSTEWQAFTHEFKLKAGSAAEHGQRGSAELIIDVEGGAGEALECWVDAVSLTSAPADAYVQAEPIEVGITGPALVTTDLANIVADHETTVFTVDLLGKPTGTNAANPMAGPAGTLALDVLDAWDRSVWNRTAQPVIAGNGRTSEKISLRLPRGYYRLLATLWSGEPGESRVISRDSSAVAVVSVKDPVPLGNRYGLSAANDNVSGYTTALGAGWVRMSLPAQRIETSSGAWDFAALQPGLLAAKNADVELLAAVNLPTADRYRRVFLEQLLANSPLQPIGLVFNPPALATRPAQEYHEQLEWAAEVLASASPQARVVFDLSAIKDGESAASVEFPSAAKLVVGYASTAGPVPERSEPLLEEIGRRHAAELRVWDLGVPAWIGGNTITGKWVDPAPEGQPTGPVMLIDSPLDPALSASRMVRSILIRALAGAQLVCSDAVALDPPLSFAEPGLARLHEFDLSPRPAMVAYERMTSLLNDATLVRWIDQPDGCRILNFEKDDGGAVAVVWRPFGLSPTFLSFAGLPSNIEVLDCFGMPEPILMSGNVRLVAANEMVRYLVAGPGQSAVLTEAIEASRIRPGPVGTEEKHEGESGREGEGARR